MLEGSTKAVSFIVDKMHSSNAEGVGHQVAVSILLFVNY